jgi:hypothetical protein
MSILKKTHNTLIPQSERASDLCRVPNRARWASQNLKKKLTGTGGPALVSAYNVMTQVRACSLADPINPKTALGFGRPRAWCQESHFNGQRRFQHQLVRSEPAGLALKAHWHVLQVLQWRRLKTTGLSPELTLFLLLVVM